MMSALTQVGAKKVLLSVQRNRQAGKTGFRWLGVPPRG
jgi:hypothetical protein